VRIAFSTLALAVGLWLAASAVLALPDDLAARRGQGQQGMFTATKENCGKEGCDVYGAFTAQDGSFVLEDVRYEFDLRPGRQVPALVEHGPHSDFVYAVHGSKHWEFVASFLVGASIAVVVAPIVLTRALVARRREKHGAVAP